MRVPFWLLKLLPMWDHVCPRCRKEVPRKSCKCPYCGEQYGSPLKVPPRILKNAKELEEYVHTRVFPRVSAAHREYLARFFTVLFSDGFESGDESAWTSDYKTAGETAAPSTEQAHHGSYSEKCTSDGGGGTEYAMLYKSGFNLGEVYSHCYVRVAQSGIDADGDKIYFMFWNNAAQTYAMVRIGWERVSGATNWVFSYYNGAALNSVYSTAVTRNLNEWYCIEIHWKNQATAGIAQGWVNGNLLFDFSGLDTDNFGNADIFVVGMSLTGCSSSTNYIDCAVVADAYIGPEASLVALTDSLGLSDAVFRNKPSLTVADALAAADSLLNNKSSLIVAEAFSLLDALLRDKQFAVADLASLADAVYRHKPSVTVSDAVAVAEVLLALKLLAVSDSASLSDVFQVMRTLTVSDLLSLVDAASTPSRILQALDAVGLADYAFVDKALLISDNVSLVEVVWGGAQKKTKLFLVLGDLAIQITGN